MDKAAPLSTLRPKHDTVGWKIRAAISTDTHTTAITVTLEVI